MRFFPFGASDSHAAVSYPAMRLPKWTCVYFWTAKS